MYTLMEDPVILPTSKLTIDRSTIRSHLLSDPNDPFNRAPLKIEEVIPSKLIPLSVRRLAGADCALQIPIYLPASKRSKRRRKGRRSQTRA